MISMNAPVAAGLKANATLTGLLGGEKVYYLLAPQGIAGSYITFFEMTNFPAEYAEDTVLADEIHLQVDIFTPENVSPTPFAEQVEITMKSLGFGRTATADLWEPDTRLRHKAMRFATIKKY
ncbi:MAG: tail completion protein gp17 [Carboxydocellales bacterium]